MRIFIRFLGQCQCLLFATLRQDVKPPAPSKPPPPPSEGPDGTVEGTNWEEHNRETLENFSVYPKWNPYAVSVGGELNRATFQWGW